MSVAATAGAIKERLTRAQEAGEVVTVQYTYGRSHSYRAAMTGRVVRARFGAGAYEKARVERVIGLGTVDLRIERITAVLPFGAAGDAWPASVPDLITAE